MAAAFANAESDADSRCYFINGAVVTWNDYNCPGWRLPTEAEWEYAARAGENRARWPNWEHMAWWHDNSGDPPDLHQVRTQQPNAFGLYDMLGNASEWVWDNYRGFSIAAVVNPLEGNEGDSTGDKLVKGGFYGSFPSDGRSNLRFANRKSVDPITQNSARGFRLVRTVAACPNP